MSRYARQMAVLEAVGVMVGLIGLHVLKGDELAAFMSALGKFAELFGRDLGAAQPRSAAGAPESGA